jgi:phosphate transport system substrate-binding protein
MNRRSAVYLVACTTATAVFAMPAAQAAETITINVSGSTLMYPLFTKWAEQYRRVSPNVRITAEATGSGAGITQAISGSVQIGASDAYMTDQQMAISPGMLNIPLAISSQLVGYNLPGLNGASLKLDGPTLAGIYTGSIRSWDDAAIAAMNPTVRLPHHAIVAIHRIDSSGDSFIFSQYLTFSTNSWEDGPSYGTDIAWPNVEGAKGAIGNAGMVKVLSSTPYGVAYIGSSFSKQVADAHLGTATLKNQAGNFVAASPQTVRFAADALSARTPKDERLSLVFAPGAQAYPLVNYEYAIVTAKQRDPATAAALRDFLLWTISEGAGNQQSLLSPLHFATLPELVRALSDAQIRQIGT